MWRDQKINICTQSQDSHGVYLTYSVSLGNVESPQSSPLLCAMFTDLLSRISQLDNHNHLKHLVAVRASASVGQPLLRQANQTDALSTICRPTFEE